MEGRTARGLRPGLENQGRLTAWSSNLPPLRQFLSDRMYVGNAREFEAVQHYRGEGG
jgi:hypothetical protein